LDGKRIRKVATYIGNRAEGLGKYLNGLAARRNRPVYPRYTRSTARSTAGSFYAVSK